MNAENAVKILTEGMIKENKPQFEVGDTVRVMETRPLSKTKRWRLVDVVEKAE